MPLGMRDILGAIEQRCESSMPLLPISEIRDYHAHIYFDEATKEKALCLRDAVTAAFPAVEIGRFHERNVGPHPRWSCQLAFTPALYDQLLPWLMLNRDGLTIFVHPNTGDDLTDHRDRAMWMGEICELDLSRLSDLP